MEAMVQLLAEGWSGLLHWEAGEKSSLAGVGLGWTV